MLLAVGGIGKGLRFSAEAKISGREIFGFIPAKKEVLWLSRGLLRRRKTAQLPAPHEMGSECVKSLSLLAFMTHLAANPRKVLF